ncbi:MAG: alpha/beta hydrolase [Gordonia sp.]|uniref:Alpha/beta hydrolase n=1 Tax=Gordonia rubripertincta TaxID=36822 RepID=A0ABT4MY75_GORRU|nr:MULTISPECIES: alpha/beta hydrolase [Mycobacteriales]MBA4023142.1 alpha/beta hydrolase [Gordonia sp. (in: high G+C Gram-positive bacteria)]MCZ4551963.1 alpha/beta hydrolase [Gordonia rubripertincta]OZG28139.1 alpha/beta hydrolase [Williamsia sp. 1138]
MSTEYTGYVKINHPVPDTEIWHQVDGDGAPVVLLHGAFSAAADWGGQYRPIVDAGFKVYVPERHGHGHSADVMDEFHYEAMADETIVYLDEVVGGPAHLVGWSDGAVIAFLVALKRPDLVNRMVVLGQYLNSSGRAAGGLLDSIDDINSEIVQFLRPDYAAAAPEGDDHFPVVFEKTTTMIANEPEIALTDLSVITAPTLVMQGDHDEVTLEHSAEIVGVLPNARLAVLPGTHLIPIETPGVVNPVIINFLNGDPA